MLMPYFSPCYLALITFYMLSLLFTKTLQNRQPQRLAFLGVKLDRKNIVLPNARYKINAVRCRGSDNAFILGYDMEGVHEIYIAVVWHVLKCRSTAFDGYRIPAHVGYLESVKLGARCVECGTLEPDDTALDDVQSLRYAEFLAFRKKELESEADAE